MSQNPEVLLKTTNLPVLEPNQRSEIVDFYAGKSILITGATGFLGKLLVEKLLRTCYDLGTIYIMVRPKKGQDPHTRLDTIYNDCLFGPLQELYPKFRDQKLVPITGDMALPNLGLSQNDLQLLIDKVEVIFHIAATVRFDEVLENALKINVYGTKTLMEIANRCVHLKSFVYVSTAFANCIHDEITERFYNDLVPDIESNRSQLRKWPNTYTFSKALAEVVLRNENLSSTIPICVVRPSIVSATYQEPLKSWIDNVYGVTGVLVGAGTGLLKSLHCDRQKSAEVVPADYVINALIAASYATYRDQGGTDEVKIYNYVSSVENRITWENVTQYASQYGIQYPTTKCIWYYCLTLNRYYWIHWIYNLFFHMVPAVFMDFTMLITGQKPMMLNIYRKVNKFSAVIAHFATRQWKFTNSNTQILWDSLSANDQHLFPFSMSHFDWIQYYQSLMLGLRVYLIKDDLSTLPEARKKWLKFKFLHYTIKWAFYLVVLRILYSFLYLIFNM